MKALVVSVGTGSRLGMQAAESVVSAIAQSVRHTTPKGVSLWFRGRVKREPCLLSLGRRGLLGRGTKQ